MNISHTGNNHVVDNYTGDNQTGNPRSARAAAARPPAMRPAVRLWLWSIAALIFIMVLVGGATRLTDSGLSITEWQPIIGAIPPLSEADWQKAFSLYKTIPEYSHINPDMTLEGFKKIFWWEWAHRFLGRFIGIAFLIPFLVFWARGLLHKAHMPWFIGLFILGGLQGALGWYMVKSGLVDRVDVSQYRLAAHLALAVFIYGLVLWLLFRDGLHKVQSAPSQSARGLRLSAGLLCASLFLQIILGAFVAGLDAGHSHNTWPLMDGQLIPDGLLIMSPWFVNFFENVLTVQFDHRILAYVIFIWALGHFIVSVNKDVHTLQAASVLFAIIGQIALGIWTLLAQVPISLGLLHQAGALIALALALYHYCYLRAAPQS